MSRHQELCKEVYGPRTECKCPKCQKVYTRPLLWIGNGTPRLYCSDCRDENHARQRPEYDPYGCSVSVAGM